MHGTPVADDPLVRVISPDGADYIEVATSVARHVSAEEERRLVHGWGVADHDHDVQAYTRVSV